MKNLASALFLTERETDEFDENPPKVKGRIVTTLPKAKEVRPLVERCITIARRSLAAREAASEHSTDAERNSSEWRSWRESDRWHQWNQAIAPEVAARRRAYQLLGDKEAVKILFEEIAPRFADRPGGYTRVLKLAQPRLGDAGTQAILEFVGVRDREKIESEAPSFEDDDGTLTQEPAAADEPAGEEPSEEQAESTDESAQADATEEASTEEGDSDEGDSEEEKK